MMDMIFNYLLFLAEAVTIVVAIIVIFAGIFTIANKQKSNEEGLVEVTPLNQRYEDTIKILQEATLSKAAFKQLRKDEKEKAKKAAKEEDSEDNNQPKIFVVEFDGDIKASDVDTLRECITAILTIAKPEDTVFVKLESPGGVVHGYGLAASQLQRVRDHNIKLVVSVDKVAASGGYLMACVANEIVAAPFAIIGSIGVLAQIPNFHRLLKHNHIDFEQLTAGEYKRTLSFFGENTEAGREKLKQEIQEAHDLFKNHIKTHRQELDIDKVATGEHWYGSTALELGLIDKIQTSDDYLLNASENNKLYLIEYTPKQTISDKLTSLIKSSVDKVHSSWKEKQSEKSFQNIQY